ncbi:hypothetical protein [Bosea sp. R86505]|uniref:hypothetical protein n=1 Tax=Bosea sp. R86505 TaxID=3101710 RepID=UPI00366BE681
MKKLTLVGFALAIGVSLVLSAGSASAKLSTRTVAVNCDAQGKNCKSDTGWGPGGGSTISCTKPKVFNKQTGKCK